MKLLLHIDTLVVDSIAQVPRQQFEVNVAAEIKQWLEASGASSSMSPGISMECPRTLPVTPQQRSQRDIPPLGWQIGTAIGSVYRLPSNEP